MKILKEKLEYGMEGDLTEDDKRWLISYHDSIINLTINLVKRNLNEIVKSNPNMTGSELIQSISEIDIFE